jgi:hypothetical protein
MAKSKEFINLLSDIKADIISAITSEAHSKAVNKVSVSGDLIITIASETNDMSNWYKIKSIDIGENVISVSHNNIEETKMAFGELSTDNLVKILKFLED